MYILINSVLTDFTLGGVPIFMKISMHEKYMSFWHGLLYNSIKEMAARIGAYLEMQRNLALAYNHLNKRGGMRNNIIERAVTLARLLIKKMYHVA